MHLDQCAAHAGEIGRSTDAKLMFLKIADEQFAQARIVVDLSLIHISEPTRLLSISYAVFCLKKNNKPS